MSIFPAHCVWQKGTSTQISPHGVTVRLGAHNITETNELGRVERNVTKIYVHPQWNVYIDEFDADVSILVLNDKVVFTRYIQPICMPGSVPIDGIRCSVVGWGATRNGTGVEQIPRCTTTNVLNDSYCFKQDPPIIAFSSSNTFCGGEGAGTPNVGDSGGGLFAVSNASWVQYGIISAVRTNDTGHCLENAFAIYTNTFNFKNWIIDTAGMNNDLNITLNCHYGPNYFMSRYKCFLYYLELQGENMQIVSFGDTHRPGKRDQDVEMLQFYNGTMLFLPNGIGTFFTNLKTLVVGHGREKTSLLGTKSIKRLSFKELEQLEELEFYRNDIEVIDEDSLWDLKNLQSFRIVNNKLKVLHERTFKRNVQLKVLAMHSNHLTSLPRNLLKHNAMLEYVDFSHNSLITIDEKTFVFNLKLKVLSLGYNQIKSLPPNFFTYNILLEELNLQNNSLKIIDENIFENNSKLMAMNFAANQLELLPRHLFKNNSQLHTIQFQQNALQLIDIDFTGANHFAKINLSHNVCINARWSAFEKSFLYVKNITEFQDMITANCREPFVRIEWINIQNKKNQCKRLKIVINLLLLCFRCIIVFF
ncbi:Serine protease gd [Pseudolycoriella hygida]|uniref:Serine protease gd n=1 Tax=Pseudolycoriella hygida TaxID=35572 RepID=A0A9Q0S0G5_9DIPT|nr:Serine protease gd [Pseudolycoriella hygida]